ncbi:ABC transporter substrate-binding protein [Sinorhizobium meliloti]|jgi:iron complex transport system substrate-binding protein|uniref:ABC transporter substrate-binding protein n=1 Tax=Rhizobium meliloti TaxID=382 RepID=UPI0020C14142|nr:ABC transporter substrate-binding protein [Sinorhizobium meliloti]
MIRSALALVLLSAVPVLAHPVTVKSCNRQVTFDTPPKRAVSYDVNMTDIMLALNLQDRMVGYAGISRFYKMEPAVLAKLGDIPELAPHRPSKEVLAGAEADFFFAGWNFGMSVGGEVTPETLEPFGIKVYELTESCSHLGDRPKMTMEDMYVDILNIGRIFGADDRAEDLVNGYRARLEEITGDIDRSKPLRVFVYDSGEDAPFTAGRNGMPTAIIEAAGGRNIMEDVAKSWTEVAWEPVVERNPEMIVIVDYGDVTAEQKIAFMKNNPAFEDLDAVKNDRFAVLSYVEATPGPRNVEAVAKLAKSFWGK